MSSLYVIRGKDQGRRFELDSDQVSIGRDRSNWIQLRDTEVSRTHANIVREKDTYIVEDCNSSNGTFVNNTHVSKKVLRSGDRLQIGGSLLIFTSSTMSPPRDLSELIDITRSQSTHAKIVSSVEASDPSLAVPRPSDEGSSWIDRSQRNLQVMYQTALAASHTLDINELLERILSLVFESVRADRGCVMLLDPETEQLVPRVTSQRHPDSPAELFEISHTILEFVMKNSRAVRTSDAGKDSRWDAAVSILKMGVREAICAPMQGRYGIVGVIYIDTFISPGEVMENKGKEKFNDEHLKLMVGIAHQAALAVEDTTYYSAMIRSERLAAMGQTIAMLSHHIKNILQGIQGGSYLIKEGLKQNETEIVADGWRMVEKNQERISQMVLDMLSFSKEREPELAIEDINNIIGDVAELLASRAAEHAVQLVWTPDDAIPEVNCDAEALHRAILNVGTNAIDACDDIQDGRVELSVGFDASQGVIEVVVADNGAGIPQENLRKIFSVFESGKGSRGTGLGLAVSQKVMREHGGEIRVTSKPGEGSRFVLVLPVHVTGERTAEEHPAEEYRH